MCCNASCLIVVWWTYISWLLIIMWYLIVNDDSTNSDWLFIFSETQISRGWATDRWIRPTCLTCHALVSSGFFDEKPDNFFIRYQVKGAQIVETTLPCSFASFPAIASGICSSGRGIQCWRGWYFARDG